MWHLEWTELLDLTASPVRRAELGGPEGELLVVAPPARDQLDRLDPRAAATAEALVGLPVIVALDGDDATPAVTDLVDVVAHGTDLAAIVDQVARTPIAATGLAVLLRHGVDRAGGVDDFVGAGLAAESAVYSTLQAGPEFAAWRASRPPRSRPANRTATVTVERVDDELVITLDRPEARNALDASMRDQLWDALTLAAADPDLRVRWRAAGPSFCAGGDLDEFGSRTDPARAHLIRLARSLGRMLHELAERTTVELHGACAGSGIELPAFAGRVVAAPDTAISLPELSLGLIPGAGGTVSLPRRIGRLRTAWLALTGATIDSPTALSWGLVDELTTPSVPEAGRAARRDG